MCSTVQFVVCLLFISHSTSPRERDGTRKGATDGAGRGRDGGDNVLIAVIDRPTGPETRLRETN